ncbi:dynein light intermediate chain-domain-containing protein [Obelidium mucronatum]|nr:dynein light intermediate chain-domain-containing protein [Obelidium mucronatum]
MLEHEVSLPFGPGVLTSNLGVKIMVVCCKADHMAVLEREHGYTDATFDYIQQSLRTICLKFGASLFYTSIYKPKTILTFRTYLLHLLMRDTDSASSFPFPYHAQVIDRESVCVPSGWDNWGLIKVQGNSFSCEAMAGWDSGQSYLKTDADSPSEKGDATSMALARALYESEIKNPVSQKSGTNKKPLVIADEEQTFLERNLELLQSMSTGNPSGAASPYTNAESFAQRMANSSMTSNDMLEDVSQKLAKLAKMKEQSAAAAALGARSKTVGTTDMQTSSPLSGASSSIVPTVGGAGARPAPTVSTDGSNNEVLSNFFQSLLNKKSGAAAGAGGLGGTSPSQASRSLSGKPFSSPKQPPSQAAGTGNGSREGVRPQENGTDEDARE